MSVKSHLARIVRGGAGTDAALQQLGADLRDLQHKVADLADVVAGIDARLSTAVQAADIERVESSIAEIRDQLRAVTDDLGDRVGAVSEFLNSTR